MQILQFLKRFNMPTFFRQSIRVPSRPREVSLLGLRFRGRRPWAQPNRIRRPRGSGARGGVRERTGENFYVEASENSVYNGGGWRCPPVQGALAGRPEMVLPLEPFAYSRLGGSGELLGRSEGGPEGARGRSWESPRATFRASKGSVSGFAEVCWHIFGSSGHL